MSRAAALFAAAALGSLGLGIAAGRWARRGSPVETAAFERVSSPEPAGVPEATSATPSRPGEKREVAPTVGEVPGGEDSSLAPRMPASFELPGMAGPEWESLAELVTVPEAAGESPRDPLSDPRLRSRMIGLRGKVPTVQADGRGELTHPVVAARLAAAAIARGGLRLSSSQWENVERLVRTYEKSYEDLSAGFKEETLRIEKILGEMELKEGFLVSFLEVLSDAQRSCLLGTEAAPGEYPPYLSPLLMADIERMPIPRGSLETLRQRLAEDIADDFKLEPDFGEGLAATFLAEIAPLLDPRQSLSRTERARIAGWTQIRVFKQILARSDLDRSLRERLITMPRWAVPEVVE